MTPDGSQMVFERSQSKDKQLKMYPKAYHDLIHEPEKEQVFRDLIGWLNARVAPAASAAAAAPV